MLGRIDLDAPRWNQGTFLGRLKYFFWVTDPRLTMLPTRQFHEAKTLLEQYRRGEEPPNTSPTSVRQAQQLYLSAFHPDSGDLQNVIGRMSFQVPGGMILIGAMITFYKSNTAVVFWQWANQSFNALVNYTNRNAASDISTKRMAVAYVSATSCALVTALGLKHVLAKRAAPLVQRFVPYAAVAAANMVNIPLMRQSELADGIQLYDENNNKVMESKYAASKGIGQVVFSRIVMATPSMTLLPILMESLEKTRFMRKNRFINAPLQVLLSGLVLLFMTPTACALFPQRCPIQTDRLRAMEPQRIEKAMEKYGDRLPMTLYFNKGL
ncbi:sideroflexin-2-like [Haliotis rufescens]|uniref:sideroflexin-2-like n=1 Tax=Haliotis rufescens TaxID=6454 RepID=UPI00201ED581|nr:sideroflexin-2-like [Haliotis rufescens]XP_046330907.2 sideroflexin-2-like [Haliotis rufescens]